MGPEEQLKAAKIIGAIAEAASQRFFLGKEMPGLVGSIAAATAAEVLKAPTKKFEVMRDAPGGRAVQHITLPEALTELSDLMKTQIETTKELLAAVKANTAACKKILRRNEEMDDDDEH